MHKFSQINHIRIAFG